MSEEVEILPGKLYEVTGSGPGGVLRAKRLRDMGNFDKHVRDMIEGEVFMLVDEKGFCSEGDSLMTYATVILEDDVWTLDRSWKAKVRLCSK